MATDTAHAIGNELVDTTRADCADRLAIVAVAGEPDELLRHQRGRAEQLEPASCAGFPSSCQTLAA